MSNIADRLIDSAVALRDVCDTMRFAEPVTHVYNPLAYAWKPHEKYLRRFGGTRKKVLLLGMNPGPWGMAQTGVPFGEVGVVRDWMGIEEPVDRPAGEHPKRPVLGFSSTRSEVSGRRLWGAIAARWPKPGEFFRHHLVVNYCPLIFLEESGRNRTPDKLQKAERDALDAACDAHLDALISALRPEWLLGIGVFAKKRFAAAQGRLSTGARVGSLLHPSPASPKANQDWLGTAKQELAEQGVPDFL